MFSSPIFHLFVTMSIISIFLLVSSLPLFSEAVFNGFTDCQPSLHQCGDKPFEVSFPFRYPEIPEQCGHPDFQLYCNNNTGLVMEIGFKEYKVIYINYVTHEIQVSNIDFADGTCKSENQFTNSNFDLSLFGYSNQDVNLTLYLNCSATVANLSYLYKLSCGTNDPMPRSFYKLQKYTLSTAAIAALSGCKSVVSIPVNKTAENDLMTNGMDGFWGALREGFGLTWKLGDAWCAECEKSSGICGYNSSLPDDPICYCSESTSLNGVCITLKEHAKKNNKGEIIGIVCGTVGGFVVLSILVIFCYKRKKRYHQSGLSGLLSWSSSSKISSKRDVEVGESSNYHTHIFSYDELEEATGGFNASRELGDGGFGTVYKGKLRDGRTVAVKRLYDHNYRRLEQFMNEVEILSRLRHQNLVTLYGCTSRHSRELLLVYEYIPNGTVGDHLHGPLASKASLSWPIRLSIAIETADALAYLHHVEPQIIHRDVKTNNILLDNNHHVKVADFGLSRLFPLDATHVSTAPQGTPGYVDPEYHQCYQLTDKSDVYSFGVVLIELISSKPAVDISRHRHEINLANLAVNKIQNCQLDQLVDPNLGYDVDLEVKRMIDQVAELAFRCLQSDREMRPGIREVLEMLRVIEDGGYKEGEGDGSDVMTEEESGLLKRGVPVSPDTVTGRWPSRTSTPNTST